MSKGAEVMFGERYVYVYNLLVILRNSVYWTEDMNETSVVRARTTRNG
jgi:hypothetical protein